MIVVCLHDAPRRKSDTRLGRLFAYDVTEVFYNNDAVDSLTFALRSLINETVIQSVRSFYGDPSKNSSLVQVFSFSFFFLV